MIKLDNKFHLENDANQWSLHFKEIGEINPKTNKPILRTDVWYCSSLEACLNRYVNEVGKPAKDINVLISTLESVGSIIKSIKL